MRSVLLPSEAQPPPLVDPYAVLACTVALQKFQAIALQRCQVHEGLGVVEIGETPRRLIGEPLKRSNAIALEE